MKIRSSKGLTLVELIVAVTLTAVVIGGACSVFYLISSSFQNGSVNAVSQQKAILAENLLQKYAAVADSVVVGNSSPTGNGTKFTITGDTLTVMEHKDATAKQPKIDQAVATIDGIQKIDVKVENGSFKYTIRFSDTGYTLSGGIVMNNYTGNLTNVSIPDNGTVLYLGKTS